jgi:hypothetical protein
MSVADVLMVVIVSGIGLSVVYVGAEYTRWHRLEAAKQRKSAGLRVLHAGSFSRGERDVFESRVVAREAGAIPEAAKADDITYENGTRSGSVRRRNALIQ